MPVKLTERDKEIFVFTSMHGMATIDVLHRRFFVGRKASAVWSWVNRMKPEHLIAMADLDGRRKYFHLTGHTGSVFRKRFNHKIPRAANVPVRPAAKARKYAALLYCTPHQGAQRTIFFPREHPEQFPWLKKAQDRHNGSDPLRSRTFYTEQDIIGCLELDSGADNFIDSLKPKILALTNPNGDVAEASGFLDLMEAGRFRLTIVTTSKPRARMLKQEIKDAPPNFAWEVVVIPDVATVFPKQQAKTQEQLPLTESVA